jgi:hypothetical protein
VLRYGVDQTKYAELPREIPKNKKASRTPEPQEHVMLLGQFLFHGVLWNLAQTVLTLPGLSIGALKTRVMYAILSQNCTQGVACNFEEVLYSIAREYGVLT